MCQPRGNRGISSAWGCNCGCCGCGRFFRRFISAKEKIECLEEYRDQLKKELEGEDLEKIKEKKEALSKKLQEIGTKIYEDAQKQQAAAGQKAGGQAGPQPGAGDKKDENVVDADYEKVKDDGKKDEKADDKKKEKK